MGTVRVLIMLVSGAVSAWLVSLVLVYVLYLFADVGTGRLVGALVVVSVVGLSIVGMSRFRVESRIAFGAGFVAYGVAVLSASVLLG